MDTYGLDTYGLDTYGLHTYGLDTCDLDTYGLDAYGLDTYGLETYSLNTYDLDTLAWTPMAWTPMAIGLQEECIFTQVHMGGAHTHAMYMHTRIHFHSIGYVSTPYLFSFKLNTCHAIATPQPCRRKARKYSRICWEMCSRRQTTA